MKTFIIKFGLVLFFQFFTFFTFSQPCSSIQPMTLNTLYTLSNLPTTGNDWTNYTGCVWNEPGDEFVFSFTAPADGFYNFSMNQTVGNPDFFLMSACNNTSTNLLGGCWDYGTTTLYLTAGTTVYLIVDNAGLLPATCQVMVTSVTPPSNNVCSNATLLPVGATCSFNTYSNDNASDSGIPAPPCGNYRGGDVWFYLTVPANGRVVIDMNTGTLTDMAMAAYRGSCGSLTLLACDDDNSNNGLMPMLDLTGLTPGEIIYIRVWDYGSNQYGTFQICAYSPGATPCTAITPIANCGTNITTTLSGGGDWNNWPCGTGTPGKEQVYSYTPTVTGSYYINVTATNGAIINYAYKEGTCSQTGWTCITRTSTVGSYGPFNLQAGTTYYFLLDADNASTASHTWNIRCPETPGNYFHPTQGLQGTYLGACMVNTCTGTYKDDGNTANYSPNVNRIYRTFCPNQNNKCLRATITEFVLEGGTGCPYDWLIIRDGPTQGSPMIWGGCGNWTSSLPVVVTSTNSSGCLTFQFNSNNTNQFAGWTILLSCVDCANNPMSNNDCVNAIPICGEVSTAGNSVGPGTHSVCGGCNLSENYSSWYRFEITSSGRLYLDIKPINLLDDYDFALYRADGCSFLGDPVRCSYAQAPYYCRDFYNWLNNTCSGAQGRSITNVTFNTLNSSSTCEGYRMMTGSVQTTVTKGLTYPLSVTVAGGNGCYIVAWFDWNKNLAFDAGEQYNVALNVGVGTYTTNITIPASARAGQTLMRVMVRRGSAPTACLAGSFQGEVEEYLISINDGTHCSNGVKDADETGVDCGGVDCVPCTSTFWPTNTGMNNTETDVSEDVFGNSWVSGLSVNAGETYYLMVNNWSPTGGGFDILWNFQDGGAMDCTILPLDLLNFSASNVDGYANLHWTTAKEDNVNYFSILRSYNAILFEEIGKVIAKNSTAPSTYLFIDESNPINKPTYYQLKVIDFDGKVSYSPVRVVYPNLINQTSITDVRVTYLSDKQVLVTVFGQPGTVFSYHLYSMVGDIILKGENIINDNAMVSFVLPSEHLREGIYNLALFNLSEKINRKILISR